MRISIHQTCTGPDLDQNAAVIAEEIEAAAAVGAELASFPEAVNLLLEDRFEYRTHVPFEQDCPSLRVARTAARENGISVHLGSLLLRGEGEKVVNRSYLIDRQGKITATYDKIHLFDVTLSPEEPFFESDVIAPGSQAVVANSPAGMLGLSICFDVRFPDLFQALAKAGAEILMIPAAFSTITGPQHWRPLLQARAIETGCYVVAAAQCGTHQGALKSYGHSMVISPWGEILVEADETPQMLVADIDTDLVTSTRQRIPSLALARPIPAIQPAK